MCTLIVRTRQFAYCQIACLVQVDISRGLFIIMRTNVFDYLLFGGFFFFFLIVFIVKIIVIIK